MTGRQLFELQTSVWGDYSQVLMTAYSLIGNKLYPMLEEGDRTGKRIVVREITGDPGINDPPLKVFLCDQDRNS
jgi:hypothetical protein